MESTCNFRWLSLLAWLACAISGCTGLTRPYNYAQPGDTRHQRSIAIAHDPYPLDDVGPEIMGGRPHGFEKPLPEVERARLYNPPITPLKPIFAPTVTTPVYPPVNVAPPNPWPAPPPVQTVPAYPPQNAFPPR